MPSIITSYIFGKVHIAENIEISLDGHDLRQYVGIYQNIYRIIYRIIYRAIYRAIFLGTTQITINTFNNFTNFSSSE